MARFICPNCEYVYDEAAGDPQNAVGSETLASIAQRRDRRPGEFEFGRGIRK